MSCKFGRAYIGPCGRGDADLCEEHAGKKCCVCGEQATQECCYAGQFVCGAPLCPNCTGGTDHTKPYGSWGFINHIHVKKGSCPASAG